MELWGQRKQRDRVWKAAGVGTMETSEGRIDKTVCFMKLGEGGSYGPEGQLIHTGV